MHSYIFSLFDTTLFDYVLVDNRQSSLNTGAGVVV